MIYVSTPLSRLYFVIPITTDKICGTKVDSVIVDDFTNIPQDNLSAIIRSYTALSNSVEVDFYTSDIKNPRIYEWLP